MTSMLLSVFAATSLTAAGISAPSETRSAQSLPSDHLVVPVTGAASAGKFNNVNQLAAGARNGDWDHTDKYQCDTHHWHWYTRQHRCHRDLVPVYFIGAGTVAGFIYALSSHDGGGGGNGQPAVSH